ncbi:Variant surface glycoprotein, partial [Trypanosoma congolense IL3000]
MVWFTDVIAAFVMVVVVGSTVSCQKELEIEKDENIEPFALLCRIYNVAKNPPINYVDLQEADDIVKEIDALNTSVSEEMLFNESKQLWNGVDTQNLPTSAREAALAQLSLNQITQKAHTILDEIKSMSLNKAIEKANSQFSQVIFGENGNETKLCQATVNDMDNRSKECGMPREGRKGDSAGKNLVVDFFCLCAMRTESSEGAKHACGFFVGKIDKYYGWSEQGPWGSSTMWASIKGGCGKHMQQHPKSTAEARHILDQFLKHLKTGGVYRWGSGNEVKGSKRKEGMLGTGVGEENSVDKEPLCNGKNGKTGKPPGGVCVYYGPDSDSWERNIDWLKKLKTSLENVDSLNNQTATIQRNIQRLQTLLQRAEKIYETTKVITEIQ